MKNLLVYPFLLCLLLFAACDKGSSNNNTTPNNSNDPNNPNRSPYFMKFKMDGKDLHFQGEWTSYAFIFTDVFGGYVNVDGYYLYPSLGMKFYYRHVDSVSHNDVMNLLGKTFHFDDTNISPELILDIDDQTDWNSVDTSDTKYGITVTNIKYLKQDSALQVPLAIYEVTGTFSALMTDGNNYAEITNGTFFFLSARNDW